MLLSHAPFTILISTLTIACDVSKVLYYFHYRTQSLQLANIVPSRGKSTHSGWPNSLPHTKQRSPEGARVLNTKASYHKSLQGWYRVDVYREFGVEARITTNYGESNGKGKEKQDGNGV